MYYLCALKSVLRYPQIIFLLLLSSLRDLFPNSFCLNVNNFLELKEAFALDKKKPFKLLNENFFSDE